MTSRAVRETVGRPGCPVGLALRLPSLALEKSSARAIETVSSSTRETRANRTSRRVMTPMWAVTMRGAVRFHGLVRTLPGACRSSARDSRGFHARVSNAVLASRLLPFVDLDPEIPRC